MLYLKGIVKYKKSGKKDHVIVSNGEKIISEGIGEIKGTVINKNGKALINIILQDVVYMLQSQLNLLSLTKLIRNRWKLNGSKRSMSISKGLTIIFFHIVIKTLKGKLYYVNI